MDFDCLTRKELQFLCKRNKIPANITNVAMADSLKALEIVEGLDEFKNQSPEKTMTSTRRKPSEEEPQTAKSTIRTRKTVGKVSETPVIATTTSRRVLKAEPEIKDENPSQSCRARAGMGSRSKVEAQKESSLKTGYATRRSVRLLGNSMSGLSLKGNVKVELVKDDGMVESEVGNNNGQSGDTSDLPLVRNLSSSLEDEMEKNNNVEEKSECDNEKNYEPENEDKFADGADEMIDSKGSDDIVVVEYTDDVVVSQEGYEIENLEEEMIVEKSIEVLVANAEASADTEAIDAASVEECADGQSSQNVSVLPEVHMDSSAEKQNEESDDDSFSSDSDFDNDMESDSKPLVDEPQKSICIPMATYSFEDPMIMVNEEALVDAKVTEVGTIPMSSFHNTFQSVVDNGDLEAMIDVCVIPAEEFAETAVANSEITTSISSMSLPLRVQLSQPTIPKVTQVLENINKENIDNHSVKKELDLDLKKVKKNNNLEDFSLRQLRKLVIDKLNKLEITDKNKEDETLNKQPFGKIRPALQTLSQNSIE